MLRYETLEALEDGLITQSEAVEQGLVDSLETLYERAAVERIETVSNDVREASQTTLRLHS